VTEQWLSVTGQGEQSQLALDTGSGDRQDACAHCTHGLRGTGHIDGNPVCHPEHGLDCYLLVTAYGHALPCPACRAILIGLATMAERLNGCP
jgi:hypothetical protein